MKKSIGWASALSFLVLIMNLVPSYGGPQSKTTGSPSGRGPQICSGHGTAAIDQATGMPSGRCACDDGYYGHQCEKPTRGPGVCSGHGAEAIDHATGMPSGKCACDNGFYGHQCEKPTRGPGVCSSHGAEAIDHATGMPTGKCVCDNGYSGHQCEKSSVHVDQIQMKR